MKWLYLLFGLLFESIGFVTLKYSEGFTKLKPTVATILIDLFTLIFFMLALRKFETSFVYMVGAGIGTALIVIANYIVFKQPLNWVQIASILLIITGTVGLQSQGSTP
jgi:small multidrug resistance pump